MKKYELIKEYPGSPKLGTQLNYTGNQWDDANQIKASLVQSSTFLDHWKEIVEEDYMILSFISNAKIQNIPKGTIVIKSDGLFFKNSTERVVSTYNSFLKSRDWNIHSVKRLSDGEIFTIGDDIIEQREHSKIEYFEVRGNDLVLRINHQITKGSSTILISSNFKKKLTPLFTTKDGVDIFEGDTIYGVNVNWEVFSHWTDLQNKIKSWGIKPIFSTKEKAEEYVLMNKKSLSVEDVLSVWSGLSGNTRESLLSQSILMFRIIKFLKNK